MKRKQKKLWIYLTLIASLLLCSGSNTCAASKKMSIKLSKKTCSVSIGKKVKLKAVIRNKVKGAKVTFKSLNAKVAGVSKKGVVTGKKAGKAKIKAAIQGKKISAVCVVTVKKDSAKENKPEESKEPEASKAPDSTAKPDGTAKPGETEKPDETKKPDETAEPLPTETPDAESSTIVVQPDTLVALASYDQSKDMTVFLLNKDYEGTVHIGFSGETFTMSGKVKEALLMLQSSYITKTNYAGTIRVSRTYPDTYWSLEDLKTNTTYYMTTELKNTYDTRYENCGAIYFQGDVTSAVSIY